MVKVTQMEEIVVKIQTIQTTQNASGLTFLRRITWDETGFIYKPKTNDDC